MSKQAVTLQVLSHVPSHIQVLIMNSYSYTAYNQCWHHDMLCLRASLGYIEGPKNSRMSIVTTDDINAMYMRHKSGEISLWCEGRCEDAGPIARNGKRKRVEQASRYQEKEQEVDDVFQELKEKHTEKI